MHQSFVAAFEFSIKVSILVRIDFIFFVLYLSLYGMFFVFCMRK